jgi:CRP-like cAMP-binding protein
MVITRQEGNFFMRLFKRQSTLEALRMAGFAQSESSQVARYAKLSTLQTGYELTSLGGYSSEVYLLVSGTVLVAKASSDAFELEASFDKPVVIGEISALRDRLYSVASVTAVSSVTAIVFPASKLVELIDASPRLSGIVLSQRSARLYDMTEALKEQRISQWTAYESYLEAIYRNAR